MADISMPQHSDKAMAETGPLSSWEPVSRQRGISVSEDNQGNNVSIDPTSHIEQEGYNSLDVPTRIISLADPPRDDQRRASLATMQPPSKKSAFLSTASFFKLPHLTALRPQTSPVSANRKVLEQDEQPRNIEALDPSVPNISRPTANDGADVAMSPDVGVQQENHDTQDESLGVEGPAERPEIPVDRPDIPADRPSSISQQDPAPFPPDTVQNDGHTAGSGSPNQLFDPAVESPADTTQTGDLTPPAPTQPQARLSSTAETVDLPNTLDAGTRLGEPIAGVDEPPLPETGMTQQLRSSSVDTRYPTAVAPLRDMSSPYEVKPNHVKFVQRPAMHYSKRRRIINRTRQLIFGKHVLAVLLGRKTGESVFIALHGNIAEQPSGPISNLDGAVASLAVSNSGRAGGASSGPFRRRSRTRNRYAARSISTPSKPKSSPPSSRRPSEGISLPHLNESHVTGILSAKPQQQTLRSSTAPVKKTAKRGKWRRKIRKVLSKLFGGKK